MRSIWVFVYGSLMSGRANHHVMLDTSKGGTARLIGQATTLHPYPLIVVPKVFSVAVLDAKGHGQNVIGEVYEVNMPKLLLELDPIEQFDHPRHPFIRRAIEVVIEGSTQIVDAYLFAHFDPKRLEAGHAMPYETHPTFTAEMGARYVPLAEREAMPGDMMDNYINLVVTGELPA